MKSCALKVFLLCSSIGLSATAALDLPTVYEMVGGTPGIVRDQFIRLAGLNPFIPSVAEDEFTYGARLLELAKNAASMYADFVPAAAASGAGGAGGGSSLGVPSTPVSILSASDRTLVTGIHKAICDLHEKVEAAGGMDVHAANRAVLAPYSAALLDFMRRAKDSKDPSGTQGLQNINTYAEAVSHTDLAAIKRVTQTAPRAGISGELGGNGATVLTQAWVLASWCDEIEGVSRFRNALLESIAQNITTGGGCTDGVVGRAIIFSAESLYSLMRKGQL